MEDIFGFGKKRGKNDVFDIDLFPSYEERKRKEFGLLKLIKENYGKDKKVNMQDVRRS